MYEEACNIAETKNKDLALVFQEQVIARAGAVPDLPAPPETHFDFSDCLRLAVMFLKKWSMSVKKNTSLPCLTKMDATMKEATHASLITTTKHTPFYNSVIGATGKSYD